jgi:hypothetical protein
MTKMPSSQRSFWQLHLSTAVVAMSSFGVILGLNVIPDTTFGDNYYGWPNGTSVLEIEHFQGSLTAQASIVHFGDTSLVIHWPAFVLNVAVMIAIVGMLVTLTEFLIRRRAKP